MPSHVYLCADAASTLLKGAEDAVHTGQLPCILIKPSLMSMSESPFSPAPQPAERTRASVYRGKLNRTERGRGNLGLVLNFNFKPVGSRWCDGPTSKGRLPLG